MIHCLKQMKWILCGLLFFPFMSYAVVPEALQKGVGEILANAEKSGFNDVHMGIQIQSLENNQILYQYHQYHLFTPASVQKLFTAVAALDYLGPNFRFATQLLIDGQTVGDELQGNVTFKFSGDPDLVTSDLNDLIKKLSASGIHKIRGTVYIDQTDLNVIPDPPGCLLDDLNYSYAAPITSIILNRNRFSLRFVPVLKDDARATLVSSLPLGAADFINETITKPNYLAHCPVTITSNNRNEYIIAGCISRKAGEQVRTIAVRDPSRYASVVIQQLLLQNQIQYVGKIVIQAAPPTARELAVHYSAPLSEILKRALKKSDNIATHAIFRKLGQVYFKRQGTWQNSIQAMQAILAPTGIDFKKIRLADGAGLSRFDLVSPDQFSKLLHYAYNNPAVRPYFFIDLPIAGKDGTLRWRMPKQGKGERIHGKTGSMKDISSLAGYISTRHHGMISFVIMINGIVGPRWPYLRLQDKICEFLVNAP